MFKRIKYEYQLILTAIVFYTRIPIGRYVAYSEDKMNQCTRYLPLVGWIVGLLSAGLFYISLKIFPLQIAVLVSLAASIAVTGAFHEDGFADFFDGFGGGNTKQRILEIMKDSRLGTYGAIALFMLLAGKLFLLVSIEPSKLFLVILCMHPFSRLWPVLIIYTTNYSRDDASSKIKPVSKNLSAFSLIIAVITTLPVFILISGKIGIIITVLMILFTMVFRYHLIKKIDGYTGDCLGALEQFSEVIFILVVLGVYSIS